MKVKKYILTLLMLLITLIQPVKAQEWQGSTGGQSGWGGTGCSKCSWLYGDTGLGARISLYKYDEKNLVFISSVDVSNDPSFIGNTVYKTTHGQSRFYYTDAEGLVNFENVELTSKKGKIVPISNFFEFTFESGFGPKFEKALANYLNKDTLNNIKKMFDVDINETDLSKYYIIVEAAMTFRNKKQNIFTYGTGYEYMKIKNEWDKDESLNGSYENFSWSQGNLILSYLYNSIFVKIDLEKQGQYTGSTRYDYYNFVNPDGSGLIKPLSLSPITYEKFGDFEKYEKYYNSNYPYGLTVMWLGNNSPPTPPPDTPTITVSCTSTCAGKSGDELLSCAENYCASQQEVDSKATKAACITNKCKYNYVGLSCSDDKTLNGNDTICSKMTSSTKKTCEIKKETYYSYKVECTTKSTVIYPTSLPTALNATEGFEYQVNIYGNKSCKITLDKEKWKFDYASSYTNAERNNYIDALELYNNLNFTSNNNTYTYDSSNSNISIAIDEKISGKKVTTNKILQPEEKYYSGSNQVIVSNSKKEKISSYNKNGNLIGKEIYIYTTDSSNGMYYHLPNVCISDKDRYTITETKKSVCENGFGPYKSYYTDINSDENENGTKTDVIHNVAGMDVDNTCSYKISDNSDSNFSCYITVENATASADGETVFYSDTPLTFKVNSPNRKNIEVVYDISTNLGKICNSNTCTINANDLKDLTDEYLVITGSVSDGTTKKYCSKKVSIIEVFKSPKCEFLITEVAGNTKLTIKTISDEKAKYYFKQATSDTWVETQTITVNNNNNNEIIGKVITSDGKEVKSESCYYENLSIGELKTCTNLYKPVEYQKIRDYCDAFWGRDTKGYSSAEDCYTQCTNTASGTTCKNSYKCGETVAIKQYCNTSYKNDGYKTIEDCINDCSCNPSLGGIKYVYRPISLSKPFPDRDANWNWYGYEKYITNDDDDPTSSTSHNPEYVIVLNGEKIEEIKKNTKNYNSTEGNDAYTDYVREEENQTGAYRSKFIHVNDSKDGGFSSYFTYIEGSKTGG